MKRKIMLVDWFVLVGFPVVFAGLALWAALTPQTWEVGGIIVLSTTVALTWVVCGIVLVRKLLGKPTYELCCGASVWTNGIDIPQEQVEKVVQRFIARLPQLMPVKADALANMMDLAAIEFVRAPILLGGQLVAGYQTGRYVRVQWLGGFQKNAFVHELIHMVHEVIVRVEPDYGHNRREWWEAAATIQGEIV